MHVEIKVHKIALILLLNGAVCILLNMHQGTIYGQKQKILSKEQKITNKKIFTNFFIFVLTLNNVSLLLYYKF